MNPLSRRASTQKSPEKRNPQNSAIVGQCPRTPASVRRNPAHPTLLPQEQPPRKTNPGLNTLMNSHRFR